MSDEAPDITKRYFQITPELSLVQSTSKSGRARWLELDGPNAPRAIILSPGEWARLAALIPAVPGVA